MLANGRLWNNETQSILCDWLGELKLYRPEREFSSERTLFPHRSVAAISTPRPSRSLSSINQLKSTGVQYDSSSIRITMVVAEETSSVPYSAQKEVTKWVLMEQERKWWKSVLNKEYFYPFADPQDWPTWSFNDWWRSSRWRGWRSRNPSWWLLCTQDVTCFLTKESTVNEEILWNNRQNNANINSSQRSERAKGEEEEKTIHFFLAINIFIW